MSGLAYVGAHAGDVSDIVSRYDLTNELNTAPVNRTDVASQVIDTAATLAAKTYVDTQDALYALPSYYQDADALNIPISARGAANGVVGLDSGGKIPLAQLPVLGAGYLLGPFGPWHQDASSAVFSGSTGSTPMKICDWELGSQSITSFQPLVFISALISCTTNGLPVIEVRISDGAEPYADQLLVAQGHGRTFYNDKQTVTVLPVSSTTGQSGADTLPTYDDPYLTAWLYDAHSASVTVASDGILSAACFLFRNAE